MKNEDQAALLNEVQGDYLRLYTKYHRLEAELAAVTLNLQSVLNREKAAIAAALESLKTLSGKWRKNGHHPFATSLDEAIAALTTHDQSAGKD